MDSTELAKLYDFKGVNVVISGGAGVLGGEMVCALVGCGANVAVIDRDEKRAEEIVERLGCWEGCSIAIYGDVLERSSMEKTLEVASAEFGQIHVLINAAGGNHPKATTSNEMPFFDIPLDAFGFTMDLNMIGTVVPSQVFGRHMAENGEGIILNISSMNAYRPLTRVPAYAAGKAAVNNFTQWLAVHMAQEYSPNIRVNALAPGFFHTKQNHFLLYGDSEDQLTERGQKIIDHTPMGRFGDPEDLLGAMLWLVSPASKFVTGVVVPIDGGFSAYSGV